MKVCLLNPILYANNVVPLIEIVHAADPTIEFGAFGIWQNLPKGQDPPVEGIPIPGSRTPGTSKGNNPAKSNGSTTTKNRKSAIGRTAISITARSLKQTLDSFKYQKKFEEELRKYDVVHKQGLFSKRVCRFLADAKDIPPLVVSIWGSDLLRCSDMKFTALKQRLLQRADLITVVGIDFREILLSKHGRDLFPKIRAACYSANGDMIREISKLSRPDAKQWLEEKHRVTGDKFTICVGHNADPANRQLDVIAELGSLSPEFKNRLHIICPMTYGGKPGYVDQVRDSLKKHQVKGTVLSDFLEVQEVAKLRKSCDMMIFVPLSDAFAASVGQALVAQSATIVGSWLPYAQRRRFGFKYWEVDDVSQIANTVTKIFNNLNEHRDALIENEKLGLEFFDEKRLGSQWRNVYLEAVGKYKGTFA